MEFKIENRSIRNLALTVVGVFILMLAGSFLTARYTAQKTVGEVLPTALATALPEVMQASGLSEALAARRTPTPARETRTPTPGAPTLPAVTETLTPTLTLTLVPSETPAATVTGTPTAHAGACPPHANAWHAPEDAPCMRHHHGLDPRSDAFKTVFNIDGFDVDVWLDTHGDLWAPLWLSSPTEEVAGFKWTLFVDNTCTQIGGGFDFEPFDCITAVAIRLHDTGTLDHVIKRKHSESMLVRACLKNPDGSPSDVCGIAAIPGRVVDYGPMHAQYKQVICHLQGEPGGYYPESEINQGPYIAAQTDGGQQYWVGPNPNPIIAYLYPENPNNWPHNFAWSALDVWQDWPGTRGKPDVSFCGVEKEFSSVQEYLRTIPPVPGRQHVTFQLVDIRMGIKPGVGTFWYDVNGHPQTPGTCSEPSAVCVPFTFTEHFPPRAALSYDAMFRGDCEVIPCFVADTGGVELVFPPLDVPHE